MAAETEKDFGEPPDGKAARWKAEVKAFEGERAGWTKRVGAIVKRYLDERGSDDEGRRFALLWANVEVLMPTLYARDPKPEVSRRFKDRDPVGRVAAMVLERNLSCAVDRDNGAFGRTMRAAVRDFLLGGQGVGWVRYDVSFRSPAAADEPPNDDSAHDEAASGDGMQEGVENAAEDETEADQGKGAGQVPEQGAGQLAPVVADESVHFDYVHQGDFGFTAGARNWGEVTAVWRKSYMTREALRKRFPKVADDVPLDRKKDGDEAGVFAKATVYEIWDSAGRTTRWLHMGMDELLDERPYPLKIGGRFPCPAPMFGTLSSDSLTPVPDFVQYQDQAAELDDLTARIGALTKALRLLGFTPGDTAADLTRALNQPGEANIVPIPSWAAFGGQRLENLLVWLPIQQVTQVLDSLHALRQKVKDDAYEVTGLSDILRGSTQASETATAQQLKAQWGGVRVRTRQGDVARFAAEALQIMSDVMVGHFDAERLAATAAVQFMAAGDQQLVPDALALLGGDGALLHYRVDVETDSTVETDMAADKQAWSDLLQGVASFMGAMLPVMQSVAQAAPQAAPAMASMVGELLTGAVRRFKAGPAVEASIEAAFEALGQAASQPPAPPPGPPPPDPVAQGKLQVDAAKVQAEQMRTQADMAQAQDDSRHRDADRQLSAMQLRLQAARQQHDMALAQAQAAGLPGPGGLQ